MAALQFLDAGGKVFVGRYELPHPDEGSHDQDIHLDCSRAAQNRGEHGNTVLGESMRDVFGMPATPCF